MTPPRRSRCRQLALPVLLILLALTTPRPGTGLLAGELPEDGFDGHWEGAIQAPNGEMVMKLDLERKDTGWEGRIDIPVQAIRSMPVDSLRLEPPRIRFVLARVPGTPTLDGALQGGRITGTFSYRGRPAPFFLGREAMAGPSRPQEPKPPFPYRSEEITCTSGADTLAGTLTIPEGKGPFPAVLLISASGIQNRDHEIFNHKPFRVIADHLSRAGIAVLRMDDRGIGGSTGSALEATTEDLAADARAAVGYLRGRREVDRKRLGVVGFGEGSLIGSVVAGQSKDVAFLGMLAPSGMPGSELLSRQMAAMAQSAQVPDSMIAAQQELLALAIDLAAAGTDSVSMRSQLGQVMIRQRDALPDSLKGGLTALQSEVVRIAAALRRPWFRSFVAFDPRPPLRAVKVPVLILYGELDRHVVPDQHLPEVEQALAGGGNRKVTIHRLPGLNHLFQPARTGTGDEYARIETTIDPVALDLVRDWILDTTGRKQGSR